jgi:hypothetical protein
MLNAKPRVGTGAHFAPLRCTDISSRTSPAALFRARITRDEMLVLFFGAEIHRADDPVDQAGSGYPGTASLIVRSSPDLVARPSRAMDSIIGQFCRKNVVAS